MQLAINANDDDGSCVWQPIWIGQVCDLAKNEWSELVPLVTMTVGKEIQPQRCITEWMVETSRPRYRADTCKLKHGTYER